MTPTRTTPNQPSISIITATFNAEETLPKLIASLRQQTDNDFEWIVADGGSSDQTLNLLSHCSNLRIQVSSQPDFGIYDALNRAVRICRSDYYIVIGADDTFLPNAIADFRKAIERSNYADLVTASIQFNGQIRKARAKASWYHGMDSFISNHSVGTAIKRSLHEKVGYYSRKFPIAADALFIRQAVANGARISICESVVGEFSTSGVSSVDSAGVLSEVFRVQLKFENKPLQLLLFLIRLIRHYGRLH